MMTCIISPSPSFGSFLLTMANLQVGEDMDTIVSPDLHGPFQKVRFPVCPDDCEHDTPTTNPETREKGEAGIFAIQTTGAPKKPKTEEDQKWLCSSGCLSFPGQSTTDEDNISFQRLCRNFLSLRVNGEL